MAGKFQKGKNRVKKKNKAKLRLLTAQEAVNKANEIEDPLADFPEFRIFRNLNIRIDIEFRNFSDIDNDSFQDIFKLQKSNMEMIYNSCSWGWDEEKKYAEMTEKTAKYLIAKNKSNKIVGFTHFRFDMDFGDEVLYCYELQLDPKIRRKGLGKFLMQILESVAFKNNMKKVILTVLKHNSGAVNFFHSLKYDIDETNPEPGYFNEEVPYQILSKKFF